jgi:uncharacterized protein GlcG (DUF336 family)
VALQREDGATMLRTDIALGKAYASAGMGVPAACCTSAPRTIRCSSTRCRIEQPGAVHSAGRRRGDPARRRHLIGAVGASGGTGAQDEAICAAGVKAAGLVAA